MPVFQMTPEKILGWSVRKTCDFYIVNLISFSYPITMYTDYSILLWWWVVLLSNSHKRVVLENDPSI